ncbi:MAG: LysM peptidoglycan-binding domain-containing M23 family metallopeptidase [Acidimicrobiales bacterium]
MTRRWPGRLARVVVAAAAALAIITPIGVRAAGTAQPGARPNLSGGARYTVRPGDTLIAIARRTGTSPSALAAANRITDPNRILAGRVLVVPGPTTGVAAPTANPVGLTPGVATIGPGGAVTSPSLSSPGSASTATYLVRPGDTLSAIATRTGIPMAALAEANGISDPRRLQAGARLRLPGGWICPVAGRPAFVNDFGYVKPETGIRHDGIDVFAPQGTPVLSPVAGTVTRFPNPLGGLAIHLNGRDGVRYYLAHLDRYGLTGPVAAGAVIGYVGSTGSARYTAPHLHFEERPGGGPVRNPYARLVAACR